MHAAPLLLLLAVCCLLVPTQLALPLSQVKLAKADVCDGAVLLSLEAALAGDAVLALVALTLPRLPARARTYEAKDQPGDAAQASRLELFLRAVAPHARLPNVRARRQPSPTSALALVEFVRPRRPAPVRRARLNRGQVQQGGGVYQPDTDVDTCIRGLSEAYQADTG